MRWAPWQDERGQSMVEFALILVPFFLMVMGIFDLGRATFYYNMMSNAVREGARYGAVSTSDTLGACATAVRTAMLPGIQPGATCAVDGSTARFDEAGLRVTVQRGTPGNVVQVTMTYNFTPITPLIGSIFQSPMSIKAASTMYVEY